MTKIRFAVICYQMIHSATDIYLNVKMHLARSYSLEVVGKMRISF